MGVINNRSNINHSTDDWIYLTSEGEESSLNDVNEDSIRVSGRRNQRPKKTATTKPEPTFMALGIKGKSHKKFRRYANANLFHSELGNLFNENELEDVTINDFIPQTPSPFSLLLKNIDDNIDYNDFVNCTEDEQKEMIGQEIQLEHCTVHKDFNNDNSDSNDCFFRIDSNIRKRLLKKHPPIGILSTIEEQVIEFFTNKPESIYETNVACSYKRFLLHACCQYLNLKCQSFTLKGKRSTYVKNKFKNFVQPLQLLSQYLEYIR